MKYDFTSIVSRENTGSLKTNKELVKELFDLEYYEDTVSMWIADMDFACSPHVVDSIKRHADRLIYGYTAMTDDYYRSVIDWYRRRYSVDIDKEWIVYSNGTVPALRNVINAFTNVGDEVIIQSPVYSHFADEVLDLNRVVSDNALLKDSENIYSIDFDDFEERCKTAKLFILCNPHNPVGNIWNEQEVQRLVDIANLYGVIIFSDEVHSDIIRSDKSFSSTLSIKNIENIIVGTTTNKTFNLAGLQGSNLIIQNSGMRDKLNKYTGIISISPFTVVATIAAYNESEEWLEELRGVLDQNLEYLGDFIDKNLPKVKYNIPEGTYLAWLDFNAYGLDEELLLKKIAADAHVILEAGSMFGDSGRGFMRINIACPQSVLEEALNRIARIDFENS